jgi:hypothetical protein
MLQWSQVPKNGYQGVVFDHVNFRWHTARGCGDLFSVGRTPGGYGYEPVIIGESANTSRTYLFLEI